MLANQPSPLPEPLLRGEHLQRIEAEQLKLIGAHAPMGFLVGVLTVVAVVGVLWPVVAVARLLLWAAMCGVLSLPIFLIVWKYRRTSFLPEQAHYWSRWFAFGYGLSGLGWGLSGLLIFPADSLAHQLFLVFIIGGHAGGGMAALSSSSLIFWTYLGSTLAPFVARLLFTTEPVMVAIGLMLLAFGVAMAMIGRHLSVVLTETLRLRFENQDLVQGLSLAKERAEAASQAKSQFLANVSHELRTPMNGVLGMMELLSRTPLNERQQQLVHNVQHSGEVLLTIINDLLDVAKIEAGKLELERLDFSPRELLDEVVNLFAESAASKGLRLRKVVAPEIPEMLQGDPVRLRQVLMNLVGNALKFTEQGEVSVEVKTQTVGSRTGDPRTETCDLLFSVRDSGIGVRKEVQERIFESFSQADGSTTRKYGGTGLGLSIAKQLTQLMGGEIGVNSQEGQGAVFWFTVRLAVVRASAQATRGVDRKHSHASPRLLEPLPLLRPLQVLLVEDHKVNQEVTRGLLELLGCEVAIAENGRQALEAIPGLAPDVIFMDCQMPEMDGFTTTAEIRRRETQTGSRRVPIIALTANAMLEDRERCLAAGLDDYLSKPFSPQELRETLIRWLPEEKMVKSPPLYQGLEQETFNLFRVLAKDGAAKLFTAIIQPSLESTPRLIETLQHAASQADVAALHYAAHTLKSSSASLGALALAALCQDLEITSKTGNVAHAVELLPTLEAEYQAVRKALSAELQRSVQP